MMEDWRFKVCGPSKKPHDTLDVSDLVNATTPEELDIAWRKLIAEKRADYYYTLLEEAIEVLHDCAAHIGVFIDISEEERGVGTQKTARNILSKTRALRDKIKGEIEEEKINSKSIKVYHDKL